MKNYDQAKIPTMVPLFLTQTGKPFVLSCLLCGRKIEINDQIGINLMKDSAKIEPTRPILETKKQFSICQ